MSARTQCPKCASASVESLQNLLRSDSDDYYRCAYCDHVWQVSKGVDAAVIDLPAEPEPVADASG